MVGRTMGAWAFGGAIMATPIMLAWVGDTPAFWVGFFASIGAAAWLSRYAGRLAPDRPAFLLAIGYLVAFWLGLLIQNMQPRGGIDMGPWTLIIGAILAITVVAFRPSTDTALLQALHAITWLAFLIGLPYLLIGVVFTPLALAYGRGVRARRSHL